MRAMKRILAVVLVFAMSMMVICLDGQRVDAATLRVNKAAEKTYYAGETYKLTLGGIKS